MAPLADLTAQISPWPSLNIAAALRRFAPVIDQRPKPTPVETHFINRRMSLMLLSTFPGAQLWQWAIHGLRVASVRVSLGCHLIEQEVKPRNA